MQTDEPEPDLRPYGKSKSKFFGLTDAEVKQAEQWADQLGRDVHFEAEHALRHELSINQLRHAVRYLSDLTINQARWLNLLSIVVVTCLIGNIACFLLYSGGGPGNDLRQFIAMACSLVVMATTTGLCVLSLVRFARTHDARALQRVILNHENTDQPTTN